MCVYFSQSLHVVEYLNFENNLLPIVNSGKNTFPTFYRPPTKLREGNVFIRVSVCLSVHICRQAGDWHLTEMPSCLHLRFATIDSWRMTLSRSLGIYLL